MVCQHDPTKSRGLEKGRKNKRKKKTQTQTQTQHHQPISGSVVASVNQCQSMPSQIDFLLLLL